jgi:hypothetical protein
MTRKSEGATAGLRRGRTLATAGLGAATLIGGLVYAAPAANAATAPTVTVTAPTNISNAGTAASLGLKVVNNTGGDYTANLNYVLTVGVPAGVSCSNVVFTGQAVDADATPKLVDGATTNDCVFQGAGGYTLTNGSTADASGTLSITPSPAATGTVTETLAVYLTDGTGTHQIASGSGTSQLVAPHAPAFNTGAVPSANVYVPFNYTLVKDAGFPAADPATGYAAYGSYKDSTGTTQYLAARTPVAELVGSSTTTNHYIDLQDVTNAGAVNASAPHFYLDTDTGVIQTGTISGGAFIAGSASNVYAAPVATWTIVANNGTGGAGTANPAAHPPVAVNDVDSPAFQLSVDFKDVSADSPFKADIDALAGATPEAIIQGFADGNFGVAKPVTRGQFVAFAARALNDSPTSPITVDEGSCSSFGDQTGFSDVPNGSQFCEQILELGNVGVINGYTDGTFRPSEVISRQVLAAFFFRLNDVVQGSAVGDAAPTNTKFADVTSKNPFSGDINWAVNTTPTTIINGYGDGTFRPTGVATRQVTAAYLARFAQDYLGLFAGVTGL